MGGRAAAQPGGGAAFVHEVVGCCVLLAHQRAAPSRLGRRMSYLSGLSDEHKMLQQTCKQFADSVLVPRAAAVDANHEFPKEGVRASTWGACEERYKA